MPSDTDACTDGEDQVLADLLEELGHNVDGDATSVGDIVDAFDDRSFGVLSTIVGLVAAIPVVGAIPGVSIITGLLVILVAGQYVLGRDTPWIPEFLRARSLKRDKLETGINKAKPYAEWIDQYIKPRLDWLVVGRQQRTLIAVVMCLLALTMIPLALIPWGVQPPATGIVMLGMAMIGRDGVFAAIGYVLATTTLFVMYYSWGALSAAFSWIVG